MNKNKTLEGLEIFFLTLIFNSFKNTIHCDCLYFRIRDFCLATTRRALPAAAQSATGGTQKAIGLDTYLKHYFGVCCCTLSLHAHFKYRNAVRAQSAI